MDGKYHIGRIEGPVGIVGDNAQVVQLTQGSKQPAPTSDNLPKLAEELATLCQAMQKEATESKQRIAVGRVAEAEEAAKANDASKVEEHLKSAGQWALAVAETIGVPVAIGFLKKSLGL